MASKDIIISRLPVVLITRPSGQEQRFARGCQELGFETALLPCLDILPLRVERHELSALRAEHVAALFTSTNAVRLANQILPLPWPDIEVHAIGEATARSLQGHGQCVSIRAQSPYNSEAYLQQLKAMPPTSLLIIKGKGGRGIIQPRLQAHGWRVSCKDVYERIRPSYPGPTINAVFAPRPPDIISVTSDEILKNLCDLCNDQAAIIMQTPLVVNSQRCADLARVLGFTGDLLVAIPAGDSGQLDCLERWEKTVFEARYQR